jgi:hypothetical protein
MEGCSCRSDPGHASRGWAPYTPAPAPQPQHCICPDTPRMGAWGCMGFVGLSPPPQDMVMPALKSCSAYSASALAGNPARPRDLLLFFRVSGWGGWVGLSNWCHVGACQARHLPTPATVPASAALWAPATPHGSVWALPGSAAALHGALVCAALPLHRAMWGRAGCPTTAGASGRPCTS